MYKLLSKYHKQCNTILVLTNRTESSVAVKNYVNQHEKTSTLKSFNEIPGPKSYPYIGTLYKYLPYIGEYNPESLDKNAWINYRKYGSLVRESLMPGVHLLHVFDPDDIEMAFRQEDRMPSRRSHVALGHYRLNKPDVYNTGGLLPTNGPDWYRIRSSFQKNFSAPNSAREHIGTIDAIVREFVDFIKKSKNIDDYLPYFNRLNLEEIGVVAFDEKFNSFSKEELKPDSICSKTIKAAIMSNWGILKLDQGVMWRLFNTPLYSKLATSQTHLESVTTKILLKKMIFYENNEDVQQGKSLIDRFLNQPKVDFKDIIGMMVDILMGAIDTTAYTISFSLYHLGRNNECQDKMFEECQRLLPSLDTDITSEILANAHYTRAVIKETLRLNPVALGLGRVLHKDMELKGYLIPKDTVIVTHNMLASRLAQYVKEPMVFRPERYIKESNHYETIHPFVSLPFGFGPRTCIARRLAEQNMCITLLRLIREFRVNWKGGEMGIVTHLINKPDAPVALSFQPRQ